MVLFCCIEAVMRERFLFIHSQDRDPDLYPSPTEYVVKLDPPLKHVRYLQLEHFAIANTLLTLHFPHNTVTVNGIEMSIPPGVYTSTRLAAAVEEALRTNLPQGDWVVRIQRTRMSMEVTSSVYDFEIQCGFVHFFPSTRTVKGWTATSKILSGETDRLVMEIRPLGKAIEPDGEGGRKSFSTFDNIPLKTHSGGYTVDAIETPLRHIQNPSVTLDRLYIFFRAKDPVVDHGMLFRVGFD